MRRNLILVLLIVVIGLMGVQMPTASFANEKLIQAAKKEGTVVLYHSMSRRVLKAVVKGFEKKYGIKVKWTRKGVDPEVALAEKLAVGAVPSLT